MLISKSLKKKHSQIFEYKLQILDICSKILNMLTNYNETIAFKIREIRVKKAITQKEIADYISLSPNAYSRIENGFTQITVQNLFLISECLGVKIEEILGTEKNIITNNGAIIGAQKNECSVHISLSLNEFNEIYSIIKSQNK